MSTESATAATTLTVSSIPSYIAGRPKLAGLVGTDGMTVTEVGDGNLNQVFICAGGDGRTLVLKQALPYVRLVGPEWPMTEQRAAREAAAIRAHSAVSPHVCALVDYDADRYVLALEDLTDHTVLRTHLNAGGPHAGVAERLGEYVADVAFGTSFLGLGEEPFRLSAAAATNTELCALTEDLIFTEPYLGADRNSVHSDVAPLVDDLQHDHDWVDAAMAMKVRFLTVQEALLHGDLHTGSVFVRYPDGSDDATGSTDDAVSVKAFDSEFAFYGPVGFDLGLLWSNLYAAGVRALVLGDVDRGRSLLRAPQQNWDAFRGRLQDRWPLRRSPEKYTDAFLRNWLQSIKIDALGFAGCEAARRTIGLAKISDVETLSGADHVRAASAMLRVSRLLLTSRHTIGFSEAATAAEEFAR
jgi:5-methylthioribose kinase